MPAPSQLTARGVFTEEQFYALKPVWDEILSACPQKEIFQTFAWQKNFWEVFGKGQKLAVVVVESSREIAGIFPFMQDRMKVLRFIGSGISDRSCFLYREGTGNECFYAFLNFLREHPYLWSLVIMDEISLHKTGIALDCPKDFNGVMSIHQTMDSPCLSVCLPGSYEQYLTTLGRKTRQHLKNNFNRLKKQYPDANLDAVQKEEEIEKTMNEFFSLHSLRWRQKWQPGVLFLEKTKEFHRSAAKELFKEGKLRLYRLRLNNQIKAVLYGFSFHNKFYFYLSGFHPELSLFSPGSLLIAFAIQHAIEEGLKEFDFLRGDELYKYRWGAVLQQNMRLEIAKNTLKAKCIHQLSRLLHNFISSAKGVFR